MLLVAQNPTVFTLVETVGFFFLKIIFSLCNCDLGAVLLHKQVVKAAGDTEGAKELQRKITAENKQLKAYCEKEGLAYRQNRTQVYGCADQSRKTKPVDFVETVDKAGGSGIINVGSLSIWYWK